VIWHTTAELIADGDGDDEVLEDSKSVRMLEMHIIPFPAAGVP
jgi:hypothetical protein